MKKTILLAFASLLALAQARAQVFYTNTDGYIFTTTNAAITITGYIGTNSAINIPAAISNMPVVSIGDYAFSESIDSTSGIGSVTMADSVTNIGDYAFYDCQFLLSVTFSTNLLSIGQLAFSGINNTLDPHHPWEADHACPLSRITIPNSVTNIGSSAFQGCYNVGSISIGAGLATIGSGVFSGCSIGSIDIPSTVTNIGDFAFYDCEVLSSVIIGTNVTSIGASAFSGAGSQFGYGACPLTNVVIPDSVTSIGDYAFYNCAQLSDVTLGSNLAYIGTGLFSGFAMDEGIGFTFACPLVSIAIPNSVTNIGDSAFYSCLHLTNVTIGTNVASIGASHSADSKILVNMEASQTSRARSAV